MPSTCNGRTNTSAGNTTDFTVKVKNELASVAGSAFSYDGNGNLLTNAAVGHDCSYDDENRLSFVESYYYHTYASGFVYHGFGRLRKRLDYSWNSGTGFAVLAGYWEQTNTVEYIYDGMRVVQERDGSDTPTVAYTRGRDLSGTLEGAGGIGGLLARSHGYSGGNWTTHSCYFADGNGNIARLADSTQSFVASYRYDAYGNSLTTTGALASVNTYRFSSKELHVNSGIYYYGYRFYDPNLQRWMNRDPGDEEGGVNLYEYAENASLSFVDPNGRKPVTFPLRLPAPPSKFPPGLGPVLGPIGLAFTCGAIGAALIDRGSEIIWPDNSTRSCNPKERKLCAAQCGGYKYIFMCTVTSQGTMICRCRTIPHPGDPKPKPPSWP